MFVLSVTVIVNPISVFVQVMHRYLCITRTHLGESFDRVVDKFIGIDEEFTTRISL